MKKTAKTLLATLLALTMLCALALPVWAADLTDHTLKAYQIFSGRVEAKTGDTTLLLSDVKWASDIDYTSFVNKLKADTTISSDFSAITPTSPATDVANAIAKITDTDKAIAVARCAYASRKKTAGTQISGTAFQATNAGYYIFVDETELKDAKNGANNFSMLTLCTTTAPVNLASKHVDPTVVKTVEDNEGGSHFGDSADHEINETFKFKLTATLPQNNAYQYYNKYPFSFSDSLTKGITFDGKDGDSNDVTVSITCGSKTVSLTKDTDYNFSTSSDTSGSTEIMLTILDVRKHLTIVDLEGNDTKVEVTYNAHLNENAAITTSNTVTTNSGSVFLVYPRDPHKIINDDSTYDDYKFTAASAVYVYTYGVNNTKYADEVATGKELADAQFKLYRDAGCANEVTLYQHTDGYYYPIGSATGKTSATMVSDAKGAFNIKGLDANTYYLQETKAPAGYNTLTAPVKITITSTHSGTSITLGRADSLLFDATKGHYTEIINNSGVVLPSTGGMGTTLFYVIGGLLMVGAAVLLVTKKRMQKN